MGARIVPGKRANGARWEQSITGRWSLRQRTLRRRRLLPSFAVAASCPSNFIRPHGRIAFSVSRNSRPLVGRKNARPMEPLDNDAASIMMLMRHGIVCSTVRRPHDMKEHEKSMHIFLRGS